MLLVVDASVATQWFLPQVRSTPARAVLGSGTTLVGPPLLQLEVGSSLMRAVRRGELAADVARESVFASLPSAVDLVDPPRLLDQAYDIAATRGGSLSDAVYIALARALGARLVTDDAQMRSVAFRAGVPARLLGEG